MSQFSPNNPPALAWNPGDFLIDTSMGVLRKGQPLFSNSQREALLCAVAVAWTTGNDVDITLTPGEAMTVDLDRLLLWSAPSADDAGVGVFMDDPEFFLRAASVLSIRFNRSVDVLRGDDPAISAAEWSPWRRKSSQRLGQLYLVPGEQITITVNTPWQPSGGATGGTFFAAVPCVPDRWLGQRPFLFLPATHGRWPSHGPWQVQGCDLVPYLAAGTAITLTHETIGIVNLGSLAFSGNVDGVLSQYYPEIWQARVEAIQPAGTSDNLLLGPTVGAFSAPAAIFASGGVRSFDWARFGFWGVSGQQQTVIATVGGLANGTVLWGCPFSPAQSDAPKLGPDCKCAC